jgi:hypothetical protein
MDLLPSASNIQLKLVLEINNVSVLVNFNAIIVKKNLKQ